MIKKLLLVLLTACMSLLWVACGDEAKESAISNEAKTIQSQENTNSSSEEDKDMSPSDNEDDVSLEVDSEYADLKESEGFVFESNGDDTCTLTKIGTCKDKSIVIPEKSPEGDKVTKIGEMAFYNEKNIDDIIFAGKELEIEKNAFQCCKFNKLIVSGCKLTIDKNAFSYDDDISKVLISNSDVEIGDYAFYDSGKKFVADFVNSKINLKDNAFQTSGLGKLSINNCTTNVEKHVFSYCEDITSIDISNGKTNLDEYCFYNSGDKAVIKMSVCDLTIENNAFQCCEATSLSITDCNSKIGKNGFSYCEDMESLIIGKGTTEIGDYAFYNCTELKNISIGGDFANKDNKIIIGENAFMASGAETVAIAGGTVEIEKFGFGYCDKLKEVTIGDGSLKVSDNAFFNISNNISIKYNGKQYTNETIKELK